MTYDLFLCADDYGQNLSINEGILTLANHRKLNAISCLMNVENATASFQDLKPIGVFCFLGLHINLTFGTALSRLWQENYGPKFHGLGYVLKKSYLGQFDPFIIEAEISAQLEAFIEKLGQLPDFIDGHQHIHQFPCIRKALFTIYQRYQLNCFIRSSSNGFEDLLTMRGYPKQPLVSLLGGLSFKQQLRNAQIPTNRSFAGIYNFSKAIKYRQYFQYFLSRSKNNGLIMCHPGLLNHDKIDPLHESRPHEFNYFMSEAFLFDLKSTSFQLRFKGK